VRQPHASGGENVGPEREIIDSHRRRDGPTRQIVLVVPQDLMWVCHAGLAVGAFDAEIYLRRMGERLLDDPGQQQPGHRSGLRGAASALVWAGAMGADQAWQVIDDYATATQIRSEVPGFVHPGPPRRHQQQTDSLAPREFRVIDQEISVAGTQVLVRDLAITADGGTLRYRRHLAAPGLGEVPRMIRRRSLPWNAEMTVPVIVDSAGHELAVRVGAGGRNGTGFVDGELDLRGPIAPEATWLEIDGTRVDLHGPSTHWEVSLQTLDDEPPVARFLWRYLAVAVPEYRDSTDLEPIIGALVAAGALEEGAALMGELRAVAARKPLGALHRRRIRPAPASGLVEPWGSLLDREGADDGPEWTLVLGAVAPPCDGVQCAANSISSDRDGFAAQFDVDPNVGTPGALGELPVTWWARDDLENHYLGVPTGGGVRGEGVPAVAQKTVRYWPALDPRAKRLDLLMCVDAHQAVISITLPQRQQDGR
jgi:hypothetical protein